MYMFTVLRISSLVARVGPAMKINNNNTCLIFYIYLETTMIPYYIYLHTHIYICVCVLCETLQRKNVYNNTIVLTTYCTVMLCIMYENGGQVRRSRFASTTQFAPCERWWKRVQNTGPTRRDNISYCYYYYYNVRGMRPYIFCHNKDERLLYYF